MSATTACPNPNCTCVPCVCGDDCRCGPARLGDLERKVMGVLWAASSGGVLRGREIADRLPEYAYTTIATVLGRLSRKGQVCRTTEGRVHLYSATGSVGTHAAKAMREALATADDPTDALSRFVAAIPDEHANVLRRALSERRRVAGSASEPQAPSGRAPRVPKQLPSRQGGDRLFGDAERVRG